VFFPSHFCGCNISNIEKEKLVFRKLNENDRELFVNLRFEYFLIDGFDINESRLSGSKQNPPNP
jgi:uncharacterized metal-binding protein